MEMKKTLLATATAAVLFVAASPAFAQSYDPDIGSGNITQWFDNSDRLHANPEFNVAPPYNAYNSYYDSYAEAPGWYYGPRAPHVRHGRRGRVIDRW
jgi:hypothetical protein